VAVAVAKSFPLEHGFWVVLGALSVLRSNAVGTGTSALQALAGTVAGFVIAAVALAGIGPHEVLLWAIFPLAVLGAGLAPKLIPFTAGQASFTVVVVVLFNLLEPTGWKVGVVRIEDVAIGCAISVLAALLLWPRGAAGVFGWALGDALTSGAAYLAAAVDTATGRGSPDVLQDRHRTTLVAERTLDDAYRLLLAERSARAEGLVEAGRLVAASNRLRLAAYSLATLPVPPADDTDEHPAVDRARTVLLDTARSARSWYEQVRSALDDAEPLPRPPGLPDDLRERMGAALDAAREAQDPVAVRRTVGLLWAEHHLIRQQHIQRDLIEQADQLQALSAPWWR
jgi:uncharacterized membrane protein YccC